MDTFAYDQVINGIEGQVGYTTYIQMPELLQDVLADVAYVTGSLPLAMVEDINAKNWSNLGYDIQNIASMSQTRRDVDVSLLNQARSSGAMPSSGSLC